MEPSEEIDAREGASDPARDRWDGRESPNLWKPRIEQFFSVESLPYLGTGKLDLKAINVMAAEMSQ